MTGLAVYAVALAVYALTAGAAIGWLDAPELVAASSSLGVAHSPGHPAVVMLGKLGTLIPVGDIPFRVSMMSAAAGAGAATATFYLGRMLLAGALPANPRSVTALAASAAWITAFAWAAWIQNVRAEVYALEALLVIGALAAALAYHRDARPRCLLTFALLAGLAVSNHHAIAATVLLPAAVLVLVTRRLPLRTLLLGATTGALGLATWLYLPVRAATNPELNWGAPSTLGRFMWTISGQAFHKTAGAEHVSSRGEDVAQVLVAIGAGATLPLLFLAVLGGYNAVRRGQERAAVATLAAVIALGIGLRVILGFDPETPDHHGYLWPAIVATVLLGTLGVAALAAVIERNKATALAAQIAAVAMAFVAAVQLATNVSRSNLSATAASDTLAVRDIDAVPPNGLLLTAYFETRFQLAAAREVFGARPDIAILDRSFLTYPGAAESEARRYPDLADLIGAPLRAGSTSPLARLDARVHTRAIRVELHPNVDAALRGRLVPSGSFAVYAASGALEEARATYQGGDAELMKELGSALADPAGGDDAEHVERALLWRDFLRLELLCEQRLDQAAARTWSRIRERSPEHSSDRSLGELVARCGLVPP